MVRAPRSTALAVTTILIAIIGLAGCTEDGGSTEAFCAQVKQVPALESVLTRFSESDGDLLEDRVAQARDAYDALADAAPKEIEEETNQVVSLVDAILDAVEQHPTDPAKAATQLRKAMTDHEGVDADRAKVTAFAQDECGVQLDATLTEGTTSTTGTGSTSSTTTPGTSTTSG